LSATNEKVCPRCGKPYSYIKEVSKGGRVYLYAVHYEGTGKVNGKTKIKRKYCYLGPKDRYEYVSKLHSSEGLELKGLADRERALEYLEALLKNLVASELSDKEVERLRVILGRALREMESPSKKQSEDQVLEK